MEGPHGEEADAVQYVAGGTRWRGVVSLVYASACAFSTHLLDDDFGLCSPLECEGLALRNTMTDLAVPIHSNQP